MRGQATRSLYLRLVRLFPARAPAAKNQRDFPVVEDERLVGMLMQEDLLTAPGQAGDQTQVANVMPREFPIVARNDRLEDALNRLRRAGPYFARHPVEPVGRPADNGERSGVCRRGRR